MCRLNPFAFVSAPIDTRLLPPIPCSLGYNGIGVEGTSALAAVLKETQITSLECAAAPECLLSCQRPLTRPYSLTVSMLPLARSLKANGIEAEGATALAAIFNETKITNLECAAAPEVFAFMSAPTDTTSSPIWQLGPQPALRPRLRWQRHLHCGGHHQAVRGAQGERRDLAEVRRRPECKFPVNAR